MRRSVRLSFPIVLPVMIACAGERDLVEPGVTLADVRLGKQAFEQSCSGCHASRDGFDLKVFGFSDTTIVRRAVHHVDTVTARNIVAYIRTLEVPASGEDFRPFQPGGEALGTDEEFAIALFGRDAWPDDLTSAQLAAIDPRTVKVAVTLPVWSDESTNLDWMPDFAPGAGVLDYSGGKARAAIDDYRAAPTSNNLVRVVAALRNADRSSSNAAAPCDPGETMNLRHRECFELRRWTSTLVALHMLRYGLSESVGGKVHDVWWDVGNAARKSLANPTVPIANPEQNWVTWMFLGWTFDQSLHPSFYVGRILGERGLSRHATFVALRSQVARPRNSTDLYEDLTSAARFAPPSWASSVMTFGLRHIEERLNAGELPPTENLRAVAVKSINLAIIQLDDKVSKAELARLQSLAQPLIAMLQ
jgi:hypothetical protein